MKELMLYIHIPFCERKCDYCDFLSAESTQLEREDYVKHLCKEIKLHKELGSRSTITSIFFGGGTPSILTPEQITQIIHTIRTTFINIEETAEITLELNPGTTDRDKLITYKTLGINRLSIGLQAANNQELKTLGRIHTYEIFLKTFTLARELEFNNINIDLMSAIPGQKPETWKDTLSKIIALNPEHISAYSLIVEEGTPFYNEYKEGALKHHLLPSEQDERIMYYETQLLLEAAGYASYEISNYAKYGKVCKHNLGYWERTPYLGVGLGASSLYGEVRYSNHMEIERYIDDLNANELPIATDEVLNVRTQQEEYIFLGLRKTEGIPVEIYRAIFGENIEDRYGDVLEQMYKKNLLIKKGKFIRLTKKGIDLSNYVLAEFI